MTDLENIKVIDTGTGAYVRVSVNNEILKDKFGNSRYFKTHETAIKAAKKFQAK